MLNWQKKALDATNAAAEARAERDASAQQVAGLQTKSHEAAMLAEVQTTKHPPEHIHRVDDCFTICRQTTGEALNIWFGIIPWLASFEGKITWRMSYLA